MSSELKDMFGTEMRIGDLIARPKHSLATGSPGISLEEITSIRNGRAYMNNSNNAHIKFPGRCINISALKEQRGDF